MYFVIILRCFLFLHENICFGYSLELVPTTYVFMENWRKLSQNYHHILLLRKSFVRLHENVVILIKSASLGYI